MLKLKVFINDNQIEEIDIGRMDSISTGMETFEYVVRRRNLKFDKKKQFLYGKPVFIKHKREEGWEVLVIKALKKLLMEEKK